MTTLFKQAQEPLTFESLNFHTPLIAQHLNTREQTVTLQTELSDADYVNVLGNYLARFYVAGFAKTRQFSSDEDRLQEFTTALNWLISDKADDMLGAQARSAYKALGITNRDMINLLRTFITESQSSTPACLRPYQEAALVFDKVTDAGALLHSDMDGQVGELILRPELRKAMSVREAIIMEASDLKLARELYLKAVEAAVPWLANSQDIFDLVKMRMLRIYQMIQDIKLARPSRLDKGLEHIYMAQAGVL